MSRNQDITVCPTCKTRFDIPIEVCGILGSLKGKCPECGRLYIMTNYIEPYVFTSMVVDWNYEDIK